MRMIRAALAVSLLAWTPALSQPAAQAEAARALTQAEGELRDAIRQIDDGGLSGGSGISRLRQALNEVERAMLTLPAAARQGAPWQTAVKEVSEAMTVLRQEDTDPARARAAAGDALSTIPALRGEETGSEGG
ncbi:MAG TPA: hypothetical protein VGN83_26600 [Falsiroseomonas sp.]|jgi:hypothetical protein|nr:hypothetical protein [Falsiroseomonas sp.]